MTVPERAIHYLFIVFLVISASGCHRDSPVVDSPSEEAARRPSRADQSQPAGAPPVKETAKPEADRIGTLPTDIGIPVGEQAPDAVLRDTEGREVRLRDLVVKGPILLLFYRGGWCPFCNFQIHEMTEAYPELERRGVTPVAVSVDRVDEAATTQATYTIPFPVLSDPDLVAHRAFRVARHVGEAEVTRLRGFDMDIERSSGRDHHMIAIPSVFVIDREGIVRWAHADRDYKVRPSTEQITAAIDSLHLPNATPQ